MSKSDHMLSILWMLKAGERITARQLADTLEIHIRTVYRYIDALCASGVPIIADSGHNGGYSLLHEFNEAPLVFDTHEQKALTQAAMFAQQAGYPFDDVLNRAIAKLKLYTNEDQLRTLSRHEVGFDVIGSISDPALKPVLQELEMSVAHEYRLLMDYRTGNDTSSKHRQLDPYGLVNWLGKWYIIGYCHLRSDIRSFRVDRILNLSRTAEVFKRPPQFSASQFFLKNLLPDPEQKDKLISVKIHGKPQAINDLCAHWLLGHMLVERTDDQAHFKLHEQAIVTHAAHFLIPYGKSIQVLEPPILKEKLMAIAADLLNYYQS
ncbi:Predicted DNA-binding transcriptional regulator YafY, contains an HTH and WYL domains [Paenibacillus sp. 1_12]|uniref:helix-turn-helix transcriptional regulator n=1 Tax=Paenibacillus sp. 1_12 TaxID=1566278 RepID=UPI0008E0FF5F|nr:YafY family protein [Paenibacillus sp. 1_12]SFL25785.1 Predicted DNA-binding transcriptional regulator YafY, contains an HTH and WYL domains [Paenibacillus sp. 1_12]